MKRVNLLSHQAVWTILLTKVRQDFFISRFTGFFLFRYRVSGGGGGGGGGGGAKKIKKALKMTC